MFLYVSYVLRFHQTFYKFICIFCIFLILDNKTTSTTTFCNCTEKYGLPAWCGIWINTINTPVCILNGGLTSKLCPGATRLYVHGKPVDDYFSSAMTVCNKSSRKLLDDLIFVLYFTFWSFRNSLISRLVRIQSREKEILCTNNGQ